MKTQRIKRLAASLLVLCLIVGVLPIMAFAEENGIDVEDNEAADVVGTALWPMELSDDLAPADDILFGNCGPYDYDHQEYADSVTWILTPNTAGNTYTLTISGVGPMGDMYTAVNGVSSGSPQWDNKKSDITQVVITDGVTSVGAKSFKNYGNLKEVSLSRSITAIGADAFYGSGITSITLPEDLTAIGAQAFLNCAALRGEIMIPAGVYSILDYTFARTKISRVEFAGEIARIGTNAFLECKDLESVILPNSITSIASGAFKGCTALKQFNFPQNSDFTTINPSTFEGCASLAAVYIPNSVVEIGNNAFKDCKSLEKVILPNCLTTIGREAFIGASALPGIYIPVSVTNIPAGVGADNSILKGMADNSVIYLEGKNQVSLMLQSSENPESASNGFTLTKTSLAVTNGGTFTDDAVFEAGKLATPIKTGYTFGGWYENEEYTSEKVTTPEAGKTYYAKWEVCTHNWEEATCTKPKICPVCGATEGAALGHSFTDYIYNNDATYDADGTKTAECDHGCGTTDTVTAEGTKLTRPSSGYLPILRPPVMPVMPGLPFTDVSESAWYYDAVEYVYEEGLMKGTSATKFSPNGDTTRGMIVTILYRQAGLPRVRSDKASWWSDARAWAMEEGISDGTNMDSFITREQLAAMLYRYAQYVGLDMSTSTNLSRFSDAKNVSGWALDAMKWAVGESIVNGHPDGTLDPKGLATRAQVAQMLMNLFARK